MINPIYPTIVWFVAILIGSLDLVIFIGSTNHSSRAFAFSIFWVTLWITAMGFFISAPDHYVGDYFLRTVYVLGIVISTTFLNFFITFPSDIKLSKRAKLSLFVFIGLLSVIIIFSNYIVYGPSPANSPSGWAWKFGPLFIIYELYFFGCFIYGIVILYSKYINETVALTKKHLKFMLWVIIVGIIPPGVLCVILPQIGYFGLDWLGPITEIIWIPIMSYAIFKYRQMNVRAVVAEVLAIGMTVIFFINIFVNLSWGLWVDVVTFSIFLLLAIYLIRLVLREAKQRDLLTSLNSTLSEKVAEQTAEVRKAFELEKHARRELEKLNETKDQFIMITQHHLRTPVTSIRWELEAMLGGTYGAFSPEQRAALQDTNTAVGRLTRIVDDFLNITALKVGSQILNIETGNLLPLVEDVLGELKIDIEGMHLKVVYPHDSASWPDLQIDASKMREVLLIILENAVKYNVDGGTINVTTNSKDDYFEIIVKNTGFGLTSEDKEKLFSRLFYRGTKAQKTNPIGMGIGLSVARAIVRAHKGMLEICSRDDGKGVMVTLRMSNSKIVISDGDSEY